MKHDNKGETAKPIQGTVSAPKSTANHVNVPNTNTGTASEAGQSQIANTVSGPKKS
jgi:hypothetical protein